jgi:hypothetical protein
MGSAANTVPANSSIVKGELVAISSIGEFRDVARESLDVVGHSTGPAVDYCHDVTDDDYLYETSRSLHSLTTGAIKAASGSNEGTLGDGMCCGYGDGSTALYATLDDANVLIKSSNGVGIRDDGPKLKLDSEKRERKDKKIV